MCFNNTDSVSDGVTLSLQLLLLLVAQTGAGEVPVPVLMTEQATAVQLNTREEELVPPTGRSVHYNTQRFISILSHDS